MPPTRYPATVGCDTAPDVLACLRAVPVGDLLNAEPPPPNDRVANLAHQRRRRLLAGFSARSPVHAREVLASAVHSRLQPGRRHAVLHRFDADHHRCRVHGRVVRLRYGLYAPAVEAMYPATSTERLSDALIRVTGDATLVCSTYDVRVTCLGRQGQGLRLHLRSRAAAFVHRSSRSRSVPRSGDRLRVRLRDTADRRRRRSRPADARVLDAVRGQGQTQRSKVDGLAALQEQELEDDRARPVHGEARRITAAPSATSGAASTKPRDCDPGSYESSGRHREVTAAATHAADQSTSFSISSV